MKTRKRKSRIFQIVAAITLNGKIADEQGEFAKYSSKQDKEFLARKIDESDVLIVGKKTYEQHLRKKKDRKPLIVFTRQVKGLKIHEEESNEIHFFHDKREDLINLCDLLQYNTVTILGGSEIYHWFLEQNLITDIFLTIEPMLFGKGKNLLSGNFFTDEKSWKLKSAEPMNEQGSLLLHYQAL